MNYIGIFFDVIVMGALGAAAYRSLKLSRQIEGMQADRRAFEQLIAALNVAASRAETAIKSLRDASVASGDALQDKINKARGLSDELEIMIQAGDNLADRLTSSAEKTRRAATGEDLSAPTRAKSDPDAQPRTKAEKELLEAIKAKQQS